MHLKTLDYSTIKGEYNKYKKEHKEKKGNFDKEFIDHLEIKYGIRFFSIRKCNDKINLVAYQNDGIKGKTSTISVEDFSEHETVARFVNAVGTIVTERARMNPKDISDSLTRAARSQISNPCDIYRDVSNARRLLGEYALR